MSPPRPGLPRPGRRRVALLACEAAWALAWLGLRFGSAQRLHGWLIAAMRCLDDSPAAVGLARRLDRATLPRSPTHVGGVVLPHPVVLAAGLVKGDGFADEASALAAVEEGRDIIPGWRILPALLGAVEIGSYTRQPRLGNAGTVIWRDDAARCTRNRVGLRNPGARAAAAFLARRARDLPPTWGLNLAVSPGADDDEATARELVEAAALFEDALGDPGHGPSWYTLNLSCPNTEDDPEAHQTEVRARLLSGVLVGAVRAPVWVKVGPALSTRQYEVLVDAFAASGVRAIVATNTLAQPWPPGSATTAGLGGSGLRPHALQAVRVLAGAISRRGLDIDVIACGGIMTGAHLDAAREAGARACMVYSALVFRGPLAAALIQR